MQRFYMIATVLVLVSCRKDPAISPYVPPTLDSVPLVDTTVPYLPNLPTDLYDYEGILYPDHLLSDPVLNLVSGFNSANPVTNEGATLGRVLFYDKNLSFNNTTSCASCHHQDKAFSDGLAFSSGFEGGLTSRNSMAISNIHYNRRFFWDTRANFIETQALMPIQDHIEMGMTLSELEIKLSSLSYYENLFIQAFGTSEITSERIALALGQFLKAMRSYRSKYDHGVENNFADFTAEEYMGYEMYFSGDFKCNNCHTSQNFGGTSVQNNGLDGYFTDLGVAGFTFDETDIGKFKTVSLRNVELTAPYMHDGRFATLEEVIDFYSTGVNAHPNLDERLTTTNEIGGPPLQFNFTPEQKAALIAFLKTLTDQEFINDVRYSNPFPE